MSELKFNRVNNEKYNTISVNIENAIIDIKFEDYYTIKTQKNKIRLYKIRNNNNKR